MLVALMFSAGCALGDTDPPGPGDSGAGQLGDSAIGDGPTGLAAQGAGYVARRGCATCHSSHTASDGVLSGQTTPVSGTHAYGPNLTPDPETGLGGWTDMEIVRAMRQGLDDQGTVMCVMPRFTDMGDAEAAAIVAYLRSLPAVTRTVPDSECGGTTPGSDAGGMDAAVAPPDVFVVRDSGPPPDVAGSCTPVLTVNEVQVAGAAGAGDEFVEIYNSSNCTAPLMGWTLRYASAAGTSYSTRWTGGASDAVGPRGYVVVAGPPFPGSAIGRFAGMYGTLAATGGGVGLFDPGGNRVDSVGYGAGATNPLVERAPAAAPDSAASIGRLPDGHDTNDNSLDLRVTSMPTPGGPNR